MKGFNLSDWALSHRSMVWYFMLIFTIAGVFAYLNLGREEDPSFTIKTMLIQANWPGASVDETTRQVTDRIEKKLEELESLDFSRSVTTAGQTIIFVNLKPTTKARDVAPTWVQVRNMVGDLRSNFPQGVQGPFFNDRFGDVFGNVYAFTSDGLSMRQLRDHVETVRTRILTIPNAGKVELIGAQDEVIYLEFSTRQIAALGLNQQAVIASLQSQNAIAPSGVIQAGSERIAVRVGGQFTSEESLRAINLRVNDRFFRLSDVATISRGYVDPPTALFRVNGEPAIGLAIGMKPNANLLEFGEALKELMHEVTGELPIGVGVHQVADQPAIVEHAVSGFTRALFEAVDRARRFLHQPGHARRLRCRAVDPAGAGDHLPGHGLSGHLAAAHLARRADHRARASCRRCDDCGGDDGSAAGGRRLAKESGDLCLHLDGVSDADRHAGHRRRLRADRAEQQPGGRIHLHAVRRHRGVAALVMDRGGAVCAAARRHAPAGNDEEARRAAGPRCRWLLPHPQLGGAPPLAHHHRHRRAVRAVGRRADLRAAAVLPALRPARTDRRLESAAQQLDRRDARRDRAFRGDRAEGQRRYRPLELIYRPGRGALRAGLRRAAGQSLFRPDGHRHQGSGSAASGAAGDREDPAGTVRRHRRLRQDAGTRAPGGPAGAISRQRSRRSDGTDPVAAAGRHHLRQSEDSGAELRLERAVARAQGRGAAGQGAPARHHLRRYRQRDEQRGRRRGDHPGARRDLPDQRSGAGPGRRARLDRDAAQSADPNRQRRGDPARDGRRFPLRTGTTDDLAAQPDAHHHRQGRHGRRHLARHRGCRAQARGRGFRRQAAGGLRGRDRRLGRGKREQPGSDHCRRAADAVHHGDGADDPAAELPAAVPGGGCGAAGPDRRGGGAGADRPAARLRGAARGAGAGRHPDPQLGDPDRADRGADRHGHKQMARGDRSLGAPHAADRADRCRSQPGVDPDRARGFLGADGLCDDGRHPRRHRDHAAVPAGALCRLVQDQGAERGDTDDRGCRGSCRVASVFRRLSAGRRRRAAFPPLRAGRTAPQACPTRRCGRARG
ncbi:protein of unknown function [Aminobacter niigataensis]|nr:protein of unknown function [Aminobacter niigataensis]